MITKYHMGRGFLFSTQAAGVMSLLLPSVEDPRCGKKVVADFGAEAIAMDTAESDREGPPSN